MYILENIEKKHQKSYLFFPYLFGTTSYGTIWWEASMKLKANRKSNFSGRKWPHLKRLEFYPKAFMWIILQGHWLDGKSKEVTWYWREHGKFIYPGSDLAIS